MDLLERYLQAAKPFLPRAQQDDILRELEENLRAQIDDREEELGRSLNADEQADILRRHGHPMLVAGRYCSRQQLIGPVFFPVYLLALKMGLAISLLVSVVLATIAAIVEGTADGNPIAHLVRALREYPGRALLVFAWTTLGFATLDLVQSRMKLTARWDPRTLPALLVPDISVSRTGALSELLLMAAALVWILLVRAWPGLLLGPGTRVLELADVWSILYVPIVALMAGSLILAIVNVIRPYWTPARSWGRIVLQGGALLIVLVLLRENVWVVAKPGAALPDGQLDGIVSLVNTCFEIGFAIGAVVLAIQMGWEMYRMRSRKKASSASDPAPARATR
jgi:hypothetical protein